MDGTRFYFLVSQFIKEQFQKRNINSAGNKPAASWIHAFSFTACSISYTNKVSCWLLFSPDKIELRWKTERENGGWSPKVNMFINTDSYGMCLWFETPWYFCWDIDNYFLQIRNIRKLFALNTSGFSSSELSAIISKQKTKRKRS